MNAKHIWSAIFPITVVSEANSREHWAGKARRVKSHRAIAKALTRVVPLPATILLERLYGPRAKPMDDDNYIGGLKATRDGIADKLAIADNDPRVDWSYGQAKWKVPGVRVTITSMSG